MPHVNIKHFPASLDDDQQSKLVSRVTSALKDAFGCEEGVISIALEPIEAADWHEQVYLPEIVNRRELLRKTPQYRTPRERSPEQWQEVDPQAQPASRARDPRVLAR